MQRYQKAPSYTYVDGFESLPELLLFTMLPYYQYVVNIIIWLFTMLLVLDTCSLLVLHVKEFIKHCFALLHQRRQAYELKTH